MEYSAELEDLLNQGYRYALSLTKNRDLAYDLVQDSYVKIVETKVPLNVHYFIKIIRNKFFDEQRKKKTKLTWLQRRRQPSLSQEPSTVEPVLEKALNSLPLKNREILMLSVVQGFTAQEISDLLSMPRGTVLSILKRTKDKLKFHLSENANNEY